MGYSTWVSENCPEWVEGTIIVDSEGNFMTNAEGSDSSSDYRTQQALAGSLGCFPQQHVHGFLAVMQNTDFDEIEPVMKPH